MSDIVYGADNDFQIVKVELGDDKDWKDRYMVNAFPDFGVFVNSTYYRFTGKKEAGSNLRYRLMIEISFNLSSTAHVMEFSVSVRKKRFPI